jgi:drug/metabolite transporter superfamily protein YnfA
VGQWTITVNLILIFFLAALVSIVGSILGVSWLTYPRNRASFTKPFNRTIRRSD